MLVKSFVNHRFIPLVLFVRRPQEVSVSFLRFLIENALISQCYFRLFFFCLGPLLARHKGLDCDAKFALFSVVLAVFVVVPVLFVCGVSRGSVVYKKTISKRDVTL